jgi:hypothetical protein
MLAMQPLPVSIWLVPTSQVAALWPDVAPWLALALEHPAARHTPSGVLAALQSGDMQLFVAHEGNRIIAAATTMHVTYSGGGWMAVLLCGGKGLDEWGPDGIAAIEAWARQCGCVGVEIIGRPGWSMALPSYERVASVVQRKF